MSRELKRWRVGGPTDYEALVNQICGNVVPYSWWPSDLQNYRAETLESLKQSVDPITIVGHVYACTLGDAILAAHAQWPRIPVGDLFVALSTSLGDTCEACRRNETLPDETRCTRCRRVALVTWNHAQCARIYVALLLIREDDTPYRVKLDHLWDQIIITPPQYYINTIVV